MVNCVIIPHMAACSLPKGDLSPWTLTPVLYKGILCCRD